MTLRKEIYIWLEKINPLLLFNLPETKEVLYGMEKVILFDEAEVLIIKGVDSFNYDDALDKGLMVCIIEEDQNKIAAFLNHKEFIPDENLFLSKSDKEQIYPILKRFVFKKIQYEGDLSQIVTYLDGMQISFSEYKNLGKDILPNILFNMLHIQEYIDADQLGKIFAGEEVVICGNGISLIDGIKELKKLKEKPYIISVGSALSHLLKEAITPDFIAVIDDCPSMEGYHCLENVSTALFYQNRTSKEVLFKHKGEKIFMGSSKGWQIEDALMNDLNRKTFPFDAGLHAGNFGAHIALALGAKKIILVGMDGVAKPFEVANLIKEGKATRADLYYGMDFFSLLQQNFKEAKILHYTKEFSFQGAVRIDKIDVAPKKKQIKLPKATSVNVDQVKKLFSHYFSHDMNRSFEIFFKEVKQDSSYAKLLSACLLAEISSKPFYLHFLFPLWEVWKYLLSNSDDDLAKITFYYRVIQQFKDLAKVLDKEGSYKRFDKNMVLRESGYIFNEKAEYERKRYDDEGILISSELMKNGLRHGEYSVYRDRKIIKKGAFFEGLLNGKQFSYHKGKVVDLLEFDHGKKCGFSKIYSDDGIKIEEIVYKEDGLFDRTRYDELGQKVYESFFVKDQFIERGFINGKEIFQREGKIVDGVLKFLEEK